MGINEMDFQWRLNWWYRPTQLDGFGTSVAEYYDCFCDWKMHMELNLCPADEADYVEAFIQNLKHDIRLRLESKGISRMRRLSDILRDAKFEESMIFLEETIKKFKAKFEATLEAHNPFDKVPSLVSVDNQEHSSDDEVVEESEELSGVEDAESSCSEKDAHREFDELTESILEASPPINQILGVQSESKNGVDGAHCGMTFLAASGLQLSHPNTMMEGEYSSSTFRRIEVSFFFYNLFSYDAGKMLNNSDFQRTILGIRGVEVTHQMFCKMPQPLVFAPNYKMYIDRVYVPPLSPLFDYVPQNFDPGGVSRNILGDIIDRNGVNRNFDITLGKLDGELWIGKMLLFTFDPGGSAWTVNGCGAFDFSSDRQHHDQFYPFKAGSVFGAAILGEKMLDSGVWKGYLDGMPEFIVGEKNLGSAMCWPTDLRYEAVAPGGSWYHMRYLHFQLNGELSFSAKCLNSQAAQQLLEKMLSTVLSIVCWLGLVEYAVNTQEFEDFWFSEMPTIVFDPGIRSWILSCVSVNSFAMSILSNAELWVEGMVFLFDPGGCVSKSSIRLSLIPIMVNGGLAADEMAKQPLAHCSQASIVFLKWQIIGLSETEMDCYTFIIIVEHFVWDPCTTLVIVPFTSLRTMLLRGMEEYSGHGSGRIDVQNGTHKVLAKLSGLVFRRRID